MQYMYSSQDTCSARAKKLAVTRLGLAIQAAKLDGFVSLSACLNRNCRKGFHGRVTAIFLYIWATLTKRNVWLILKKILMLFSLFAISFLFKVAELFHTSLSAGFGARVCVCVSKLIKFNTAQSSMSTNWKLTQLTHTWDAQANNNKRITPLTPTFSVGCTGE